MISARRWSSAYDPSLMRLDRFLRKSGRDLAVEERLSLLRSIAETIAYAHRRVLTHRALNPNCVWVRADSGSFTVQVTDWQTASRGDTSSGGTSATSTRGYADLAELGSTAYFAPEWEWGTGDGFALDVFGMGAITYHVITGHPPAAGYAELAQHLSKSGCLSVAQPGRCGSRRSRSARPPGDCRGSGETDSWHG